MWRVVRRGSSRRRPARRRPCGRSGRPSRSRRRAPPPRRSPDPARPRPARPRDRHRDGRPRRSCRDRPRAWRRSGPCWRSGPSRPRRGPAARRRRSPLGRACAADLIPGASPGSRPRAGIRSGGGRRRRGVLGFGRRRTDASATLTPASPTEQSPAAGLQVLLLDEVRPRILAGRVLLDPGGVAPAGLRRGRRGRRRLGIVRGHRAIVLLRRRRPGLGRLRLIDGPRRRLRGRRRDLRGRRRPVCMSRLVGPGRDRRRPGRARGRFDGDARGRRGRIGRTGCRRSVGPFTPDGDGGNRDIPSGPSDGGPAGVTGPGLAWSSPPAKGAPARDGRSPNRPMGWARPGPGPTPGSAAAHRPACPRRSASRPVWATAGPSPRRASGRPVEADRRPAPAARRPAPAAGAGSGPEPGSGGNSGAGATGCCADRASRAAGVSERAGVGGAGAVAGTTVGSPVCAATLCPVIGGAGATASPPGAGGSIAGRFFSSPDGPASATAVGDGAGGRGRGRRRRGGLRLIGLRRRIGLPIRLGDGRRGGRRRGRPRIGRPVLLLSGPGRRGRRVGGGPDRRGWERVAGPRHRGGAEDDDGEDDDQCPSGISIGGAAERPGEGGEAGDRGVEDGPDAHDHRLAAAGLLGVVTSSSPVSASASSGGSDGSGTAS